MSETVERNNRFYTKENGEIITENEQLKEWLVVANKEIERLNNIIKEIYIKALDTSITSLDLRDYIINKLGSDKEWLKHYIK